MTNEVRTVAVVGAGIGGLATAVALDRAGFDVTVFERAGALAEVGAGISLWSNATRVLDRLGVLDAVRAVAGPIQALNVRDAGGRVLLRVPTDGDDVPALCVYRPELIDALADRLPRGVLQMGHELVGVRNLDERPLLVFRDGTSDDFDIVVGADGLRSIVRSHVFTQDAAPVYRGYCIWRGMGRLPDSFQIGEISESWGNGHRFGLLDAGGGRAYWYATGNRPEGESDGIPQERKSRLLDLFSQWHDPIPELVQSTPDDAILFGNTYDRKPRRGWSRGGAVLVGDAAHPTTPNMGQGGCMAIEDSIVLATCLQRHPTRAEAFASYERFRYRRTSAVTTESLWTGRLGQASGALAGVRNWITGMTPTIVYTKHLDRFFRYDADNLDFLAG